jgi:hypothetical protein
LAAVDVFLSNKYLSCGIYYDLERYRGRCIDITTETTAATDPPTATVLNLTTTDSAAKTIQATEKATAISVQCTRQNRTNESIICDFALLNSKIYEQRLKIDATTGGLTGETNIEYWLYGDSFPLNLRSSSNFIAVNTFSFEDVFNRIQIFKRTSFSGNSSAVFAFYSLDLKTLVNQTIREYSAVNYQLYSKTGEIVTRLMVEDTLTTAVSRIYNITEATLQVLAAGYYEQIRLSTVNLTINNLMVLNRSQPIYAAFMNPGSATININDLVSESIFKKLLWLWITIASVIFVVVTIILCYFCRRESVDKYKISL